MEIENQDCNSNTSVHEASDVKIKQIYGPTCNLVIYGTSDQTAKMFEAIAKYYAEVENPENTTINPFFKAKYAPLNEVLNTIRPVMSKYGLACTQTTGVENGECFVSTLLTHSGGGYIYYPVLRGKPTKQDIQGIGATITYLRRFALNAVAGVAGEVDDDGNGAARPNAQPPKKSNQDRALTAVFDQISSAIKELKDKEVSTDIITNTVKENCLVNGKKTANYKKISDVDEAKKVLKAIKELGGKE